MASLLDLSIATGLFFVFVVFIMVSVLTYYTSFNSALLDSELRTNAANVKNVLLGGKGVPDDWENRTTAPVRVGLINDLFRMPVIIATTNSTPLSNTTLNFTVDFDPDCMNRTRESTIRIYNETNHEHPFTLYNKTTCPGGEFVKRADVVVNVTMPALTGKTYYVYFSSERDINAADYGTRPFPTYTNGTTNVSNYTVVHYPVEAMKMVSPSKLKALRNLTLSQVLETLGSQTRFKVEVDLP